MTDELEKKFEQLAEARAQLEEKIRKSEAILHDIDEQMLGMQERQRTRMKADNRVDNKMIDSIQKESEAGRKRANALEEAHRLTNGYGMKQSGARAKSEGDNLPSKPMIKRRLTEEEVTVKPAEKPSKDADA